MKDETPNSIRFIILSFLILVLELVLEEGHPPQD